MGRACGGLQREASAVTSGEGGTAARRVGERGRDGAAGGTPPGMSEHNQTSEIPDRFEVTHHDDGARLTLRVSESATVILDLDVHDLQALRDRLDRPAPRPGPRPQPLAQRRSSLQPVFTTRSADPVPPKRATADNLELFREADHYRRLLGVSREDLATAVNDPDEQWEDRDGVATVAVRGDVAAVVGVRTGAIMAVMPAQKARASRQGPA